MQQHTVNMGSPERPQDQRVQISPQDHSRLIGSRLPFRLPTLNHLQTSPSTTAPNGFANKPVNFIPYAIVTTVSAPCFGIPSLIHAVKSRIELKRGNVATAWHHSKMALICASAGHLLLAVALLLSVVILTVKFQIQYRRSDSDQEPTLFLQLSSEVTTQKPGTLEPIQQHFMHMLERKKEKIEKGNQTKESDPGLVELKYVAPRQDRGQQGMSQANN